MEIELEPRLKSLAYKVKGMSRESPSQKATHVLDSDLRSHWSTGTNTKEWILLELDEPGLLSHIRIYNKSVLEWEISVGLRFKPETFVKVRSRCEAPRRDMTYSMSYTPCRFVRISCLRGNPIAIFFIQLIGVSVIGLEPEFQPVVNYMLPHIVLHKQDAQDMHLQLLQDMTSRLLMFLPQLEADLNSFSDVADSNLRFLAMLAGPFYPILHIVKERVIMRSSGNIPESEGSKYSQLSSSLTVSSNFEPRRSRSTIPYAMPVSSFFAFRPNTVFALLRKAYKDSHLGTVCRIAARALHKLIEPSTVQEASISSSKVTSSFSDEMSKSVLSDPALLVDYSNLFGEEFRIPDDCWESSYLNVLDIGAVEEGILHILYACVSQPLLCCKLAGSSSDFWSALPLVQALLPALRPSVNSNVDHVDDSFSQWKQPFVQQALAQIVSTLSSSLYRPLLHACAGYLSSFSPSHAKAACVLIDLCSGVLAPWMAQVIAKVDLAVELLEDLLGTIQGAQHSSTHADARTRARAAFKFIVLALSGYMDDILGKYKEVKYHILFLVEMLEPFIDPAMIASKSTIAFGDVSPLFSEKQEQTCLIALNIIRTAVQKHAVLPSLESEWRRETVAPSVLLSILDPRMQLPREIDLCKPSVSKPLEQESSNASSVSSILSHRGASSKSNCADSADGKIDVSDMSPKVDTFEDVSLFFAPPELRSMALTNIFTNSDRNVSDSCHGDISMSERHRVEEDLTDQPQNGPVLDAGFSVEYFNLHADYMQVMNYRDCELRASEFRRLALDLHSRDDITLEGHEAAIDALLLAAECFINPFFMTSVRGSPSVMNQMNIGGTRNPQNYGFSELKRVFEENWNLETLSHLERKRDKIVLELLLEAAKLDITYKTKLTDGEHCPYSSEGNERHLLSLSLIDTQSADAITLVRQNQALLCNFLIQRLQRDQHFLHDILMQSLLFLLCTSTKLFCSPELVINIILGSAEYLNGLLITFYNQYKEGILQLDPEKVHSVERRWMLLQRLVIASSGGNEGSDLANSVNNGFRYENLIPPSAWIQKIPTFSCSDFPLVRYLGWMAVSRNAELYLKGQLFLASDLSQLTNLLSIFAEELARVDNVVNKKDEDVKIEQLGVNYNLHISKRPDHPGQQKGDQFFGAVYPELSKFFPNMTKQFEAFGEIILEAVGLQLRSLCSSILPDILCWFSNLCSWPFLQKEQFSVRKSPDDYKGYVGRNARAIILYILEAIVVQHMEAMVPEIPKVVQVLVSLCRASYCDVSFLTSILHLLKPIVSYSLSHVANEENLLSDDSCLNFESLCFDELFSNIRDKRENRDGAAEKVYSRALTIYILASVFPDLSIQRKRDFLRYLIVWADFGNFEPTTLFHDYLGSFQTAMESFESLFVHTLRAFGVIPLHMSHFPELGAGVLHDDSSELHLWFLNDICHGSSSSESSEKLESDKGDGVLLNQKFCPLSAEEIGYFSNDLECVISKLNPTIELCWKLHHQLAKKLALTTARCFIYSRCLSSIAQKVHDNKEGVVENPCPSNFVDEFLFPWRIGLEELAEIILMLQENHCWEVASLLLDCLLAVPKCFHLDNLIGTICSAIKNFTCSAPRISWRLQADKWLSILFARGVHSLHGSEVPLVDLFSILLCHPEPEQRSIALCHLGRLVGQDVVSETAILSSTLCSKLVPSGTVISASESVLPLLVSSTWDRVVAVASSDSSFLLRIRAMVVLVDYIPFADRCQIQSFLVASDSACFDLGKLEHAGFDGPLRQISLALIACACLHSPAEDFSLIPENVWINIETIGMSKSEGRLGDLEKKACLALCRLRNEGDEAKEVLKEVLSSSGSKECAPDFGITRESILQVLANLTSVQSYFDFFSNKVTKEVMAQEEAEIEMEIVQKECAHGEPSRDFKEKHWGPLLATNIKDDNRLQQIKDCIRSIEKSKIREDVVARRQKKLLMRRARQKYLDEASIREAELLQELDRERSTELEREIERQRLLELERAKTRELRHNLDMEKERQTQRELQRDLEQMESGNRASRRDFSTHSSRPRERYRERENGRSGNEGSLRASTSSLVPETALAISSLASMPPVVLSGPRPFSSGQLPTILHSRDRPDECSSSYEENFDGSKDSGDTGSIEDPELVPAFDGTPGVFGPVQRHGSRGGSKSKPPMERRERDGRREGKWERKHP
ncbi:uncharacterized protein LOC131158392 [Malania oleifera]|uniref:uncharacterized protein LOC131158392 n=1 Tax=Malania oleifera TaxID=397392 RepID=UPI0025AE9D75|nr:uncharacterized protein LOC131158392 [Malania oleifera]